MKRMLRLGCLAVFVVLWLIVGAIAFEVYHVYRWRQIEENNVYVRARYGAIPWPTAAQDVFQDQARLAEMEAQAAAHERQPEPEPVAELAWRARYFLELNEGDRNQFATVYEQQWCLFEAPDRLSAVYPVPAATPEQPRVEMLCPPRVADWIGERLPLAYASHTPETVLLAPEGGQPETAVFLLPPVAGPGGEGTAFAIVEEHRNPEQRQDPDFIWKIPFFEYKKHAQRHAEAPNPNNLGVMHFQLNNYGFRDDDVVSPKPDGVFRIVCVGASTTEEGPRNSLTYPNILERRLRKHFNTDRIEVLNCGISGLNVMKERMRLADYLALEPDLLIIYEGVNDICHIHFPRWVGEMTPLQQLLRRSRAFTYYFNRWLAPPEERMRAELESGTLAQLLQIRNYARARGIETALCSFAYPDIGALSADERAYYDFYNWKDWGGRYVTFDTYCRVVRLFNASLRAMCRKEGILYIPVEERVTGGADVFGDICHMKNVGIERKAEAVFEAIKGFVGARFSRG